MKIACVSSLFYKLQIPENKTDFRDDFFFFLGKGGGYARNLLIKVKNMYLLIFFIMSVRNHTIL